MGQTITSLTLGSFTFLALIIGLSFFYTDLVGVYSPANSTGIGAFATYNTTFKKMEDYSNDIEEKTAGIAQKGFDELTSYTDTGLIVLDMIGVILTGVQTALTVVTTSVWLAGTGGNIAVPGWFNVLMVGGAAIYVGFKIAAFIARVDEV